MTQQKTIFYEGQKVFCSVCGQGEVISIVPSLYAVTVKLSNDSHRFYTEDGKLYHDAIIPTLYPYDQYLEIKSMLEDIPLPQAAEGWKPNKGELILVTNELERMPNLRRFTGMSGRKFRCKSDGDAGVSDWNYAFPFTGELPEYVKGGRP